MTAATDREGKLADLTAEAARYARQRADDPWAEPADAAQWNEIAARLEREQQPRPAVHEGDPTFELVAKMVGEGRTRRTLRVGKAMSVLRPYERRIAMEAAVMGFVLGYRDGVTDTRLHGVTILDGKGRFPHDRDILANVIQHCDSTSEIYPYLAAACDGKRRRITPGRRWPGEEAS